MKRQSSLVCTHCSRRYSADEPVWRCTCGGLLDLFFDAPWRKDQFTVDAPGMWRYRYALPLNDDAHIVSFGEGATPLISQKLDDDCVYLKLDYLFPTGSFKDRGAAMLISKMKELGIRHAVEDSSGNAGAAIAAYCARAGIDCDIYAPASTSAGKLRQIEAVGRLQKISGNREQVAEAALQAAEQSYYASHAWNPFFFHGVKTCAFEIFEQLGRAPEIVFAPVGNGTLKLGLFLGFSELLAAGMIARLPRLIAVQTSACAPLAEAFAQQSPTALVVDQRATLAEGIAVAQPVRGRQILWAVQKSNGAILQVTEAEIASSLKTLHSAGLYIEPTAAVAVAGYRKWRTEGRLSPVVIVLTGHGLKTANSGFNP